MKPLPSLVLGLLGAGSTLAFLRPDPAATEARQATSAAAADDERLGPGPVPVDEWHPARATKVEPAYGGTFTVHSEALPPLLNTALLNSTNAKVMLQELHANLVRRDWESWALVPDLATGWDVADTVVTGKGVTHGRVEESGERVLVTPLDAAQGAQPVSIPRAEVERIERATVVTFRLREGARWHDGHPFDVEDVLFSWRIAANPGVNCEWVRPYLSKITRAEKVAGGVRFFFAQQYFNTLALFADTFCILPRHLYDLRDPDHAQHAADASDAQCATAINENPHNSRWVGLGPYRLVSTSPQGVEAERFDEYFDPDHGGYFDRIVWRHVANDEAAFQALLNGQLDFTMRISSDQYFGAATAQEAFTRSLCKGYFYLGNFNYIPWNLRRPKLADLRVRKALAHAIDRKSVV